MDLVWLQVIETQIEMPIIGAMTLFVSLLTFTLRVHPDRLDYVDQILVRIPPVAIFPKHVPLLIFLNGV